MNSNLYRLVYCSRNRMVGTPDEVIAGLQKILASSRINNSRQDVSGALLYNDGNFAQVLEGPLEGVSRIFEKIQCDQRHSEVTVVQNGPVLDRDFPNWSMAFAGSSAREGMPLASAAFGAVSGKAASGKAMDAGAQVITMLRDLVTQEDDWILLDA